MKIQFSFRRLAGGTIHPVKRSRGYVAKIKIAVVGLIAALGILLSPGDNSVRAQTLDEELNRILSGGCPSIFATVTAELLTFCGGGVGAATSTGGGAAATQSVKENFGAVLNRLERTRENGEKKSASADAEARFSSGINLFFSTSYESLEKDQSGFEDGYEPDIPSFTLGGDYAVSNSLILGAALTYSNANADFDGGGGFNNHSFGGVVYASVAPVPNAFVDVVAGYARKKLETTRVVFATLGTNTAAGNEFSDTNGDEITASVSGGYNFSFGRITLGPKVGLNYTHVDIDAFSEKGSTGLGMNFKEQTNQSLQSILGFQSSIALSTEFGVIIPQFNAEYVHEFKDDQRAIDVSFVQDTARTPFAFKNEAPDRNYANLGAGVVLQLPKGIAAFANVDTMVGNSRYDSWKGTIGFRLEL